MTKIKKEAPVISGYLLFDDETNEVSVVTTEEINRAAKNRVSHYQSTESVVDLQKTVDGSTQSTREVRGSVVDFENSFMFGKSEVEEPPFDPYAMVDLLLKDATHNRAVITKVTDSVGRDLKFEPTQPLADKDEFDKDCDVPVGKISEESYNNQLAIVKCFIEDANPDDGFASVWEMAAKDCEAIGWGAIEVIRGANMKIKHIAHIPAARLRVLRGKKGFVELIDESVDRYRYYLPFGQKVLRVIENEVTGQPEIKYYSPADGELSTDNPDLKWNLIDQDTGEPLLVSPESIQDFVAAFRQSANEVIYVQKRHPATIYYGYPDVTPAISSIVEKLHISNWSLNYFENNTVPRFAIIIEGGKLDPETKKLIQEYFSQHIKSNKHVTPVLEFAAPTGRGSTVKVRFERLDNEHKEGDYLETKRERSAEIREAHGMPPAISGVTNNSELGSGKGLSQAEIYKDRIIVPLQKVWSRAINQLFQMGLGVNLVRAFFSPLDIRDKYNEMQIITGYVDRGIYSLNEARGQVEEVQGLLNGGDRAFIRAKEGAVIFVDTFTATTGQMSTKPEETAAEPEEMPKNTGIHE